MPKKFTGRHIDLFEQKIDFEPNSGCWLWSTRVNSSGYGWFFVHRKAILAHRYSYAQYKGAFENHWFVCHHCDERSCVNPDHLFLGTQKDNMADCARKKRLLYRPGEKSTYVKLTADQVIAIRSDDRKLKEIAKDYGIASGYVSTLKSGTTWKHLL
ncbi:HNH endonuclease signature motif containing protein [Methylobacterium mesophilicum]